MSTACGGGAARLKVRSSTGGVTPVVARARYASAAIIPPIGAAFAGAEEPEGDETGGRTGGGGPAAIGAIVARALPVAPPPPPRRSRGAPAERVEDSRLAVGMQQATRAARQGR